MKKSNEAVRPRYTNQEIESFNYSDNLRKSVETTRLDKRKKIKFSQRIGLYVGMLGVLSILGGGVAQARPEEKESKSRIEYVIPEIEIDDIWERVKKAFENSNFQILSPSTIENKPTQAVTETLETIPNPTSESKSLVQETVEISKESEKSQEEGQFPTNSPSNLQKIPEIETQTPTPDPMEVVPASFKLPFEHLAANKFMARHNLTLADLYYPSEEKIKEFRELYNQEEVLPIFSDEVMQWSGLVTDLCKEHNKNNPQNRISPNFILAIMSIESQGNSRAQSHMGALGLMQLTTPAANQYGYTSSNILIPENNIRASIKYFADAKDLAILLGLKDNQIWEFAIMHYNGGSNADKFLKTSRVKNFFKSESIANKIFEIDEMGEVRNLLISIYGSDTVPGYEYWSYGTRLTKVETLKYREKVLRYVLIAEAAQELKNQGFNYPQIKKLLRTSKFIKSVNVKIRSEIDSRMNYFQQKEVYSKYLENGDNLYNLPDYDDGVETNPADYLMYR